MRPERVNEWLARVPFIPFRINLSNGRHYDVHDPHCVLLERHDMIVGELDPDFPFPLVTKSTFVAYMHINTIEPLPQPATAG